MSDDLSDALTRGEARLARAGVPTPRVDATLLLAHVFGVTRGELEIKTLTGGLLGDPARNAYEILLARREQREPLQHILGTAAFRTIELAVGPGVFVPRPETELLTELALEALDALPGEGVASSELCVVDLCTGSGAIALSIASERPDARVWGVELSADAFAWAQRNLNALGLPNVTLHLGSAADALPELDATVSLVVANPPYVPRDAVPRDPEVRLFDPDMALYGGDDGLDVVRQVSATAYRLLAPGGSVFIEHGELQGAEVAAILSAEGFMDAQTLPDLTGRDRITLARR